MSVATAVLQQPFSVDMGKLGYHHQYILNIKDTYTRLVCCIFKVLCTMKSNINCKTKLKSGFFQRTNDISLVKHTMIPHIHK